MGGKSQYFFFILFAPNNVILKLNSFGEYYSGETNPQTTSIYIKTYYYSVDSGW